MEGCQHSSLLLRQDHCANADFLACDAVIRIQSRLRQLGIRLARLASLKLESERKLPNAVSTSIAAPGECPLAEIRVRYGGHGTLGFRLVAVTFAAFVSKDIHR
jgi:hypothetical protein